MLTEKEKLVIKMLEAVSDFWEPAKGFIMLIKQRENNRLPKFLTNDNYDWIDDLQNMLFKVLKDTKSDSRKRKTKKMIDVLEIIKRTENFEDINDFDHLINEIDAI